jgi:uncharacterized protein YndB with AHSA1/START domain
MEQKTKVTAKEGCQEVFITREFDVPVELLFRAHAEADIIEQWMGTRVLKLESKQHGGYQFETTDPKGNKHRFNGVIHTFLPNKKITRTFELENTPLEVWLEYLDFESITDDTSQLTMHVIYRSLEQRDQVLKMPFVQGINWAHSRLEEIVSRLK